jgi:hypothetical protein
MTLIAPQTRIDPLHAFVAGAFVAGTPRPMPLVATRFAVLIDGGLAIVSTVRTFRNAEHASIEATITFPVPVHATLFALKARIADRVLDARAQRRRQAREAYEHAIDRGKTAVLHEEVLRGVHMLSVAHVPPGAEVEIDTSFALTLANLNGRGCLRIPLTVGDIYGRSGLSDSDELVHGGKAQLADLTVECRDGTVALIGGELAGGRAKVRLDAPIDLDVSGWAPKDLHGRAADGRDVILRVEPTPRADTAFDVAILVDHSGSMGERCSELGGATKHTAISRALAAIGRELSASDIIDLWEFNDGFGHVGSTRDASRPGESGAAFLALIKRLREPSGGTEIGRALEQAIARSSARDVLLVTDGKSHALDVHALARSGRRVSVVLVGEDSLEANVGHLAALTGGEIFVAAELDLAAVLAAAVRSLRTAHDQPVPISGAPQHLSGRRAGMTLTATWREDRQQVQETVETRAVAAIATSLALPALAAEAAAELAEAEGLVTHLTSLVLVDEAGSVQEGIPATRKIPLPSPRTAVGAGMAVASMSAGAAALDSALPPPPPRAMPEARFAAPPRGASLGRRLKAMFDVVRPGIPRFHDLLQQRDSAPHSTTSESGRASRDLASLAASINWNLAPQRLRSGDLPALDPAAVQAIREAAATSEVIALARRLAIDPVVLVIALMARAQSARNRSAARLARAILDSLPRQDADAAARLLGLD